MDRVDYYSVGMNVYNNVRDPHCIPLIPLFLQGEKGAPGEQVSHTITLLTAQMSQGAHNHNDSRLLSLFADRDLQESVVELP